ncbi:uncharacterized protein [Littorina saxatilis]|uniref:uncharacterized protein n=1 Tax=Littorina saxatilis TaxID=31220 RepID=UPI0038B5D776
MLPLVTSCLLFQSRPADGPASLGSIKDSKSDTDQQQDLLTERDEVLAHHNAARCDTDQTQNLQTRMHEVLAQHKATIERQDATLRRAGDVQRTLVALNQRSLQDPADHRLAADIDSRLREYQALLDRADTLQQEVSRLAQLHASLAMSQPHQPLAGATTAPHNLLQPGIKPALPVPGFAQRAQPSQLSSGLGSAFVSVQSSFPALTNMRPTLVAPFQFPSGLNQPGFQFQGPAFSAFSAPLSAFSCLPTTSLASAGAGSMAPLSANFMVPGCVRPFGGLPTTSVPSSALGTGNSFPAATPPHRYFSPRSSCPNSAGSLANLTTTSVASGAGGSPLGRSVTSNASISLRQELKSLVNQTVQTAATPVRQRDEDERKQLQSNCAPGLSEAWAFDTSDKEPALLSSTLSSQKARPGGGTTCTSAGAKECLQGGVGVAVRKAKGDTATAPRIPRGFVFTATQPSSTKESKNTAPITTTTPITTTAPITTPTTNNSNQKRQRPVSPPPPAVPSSPTKLAAPAKTSPQAFKALLPLKPIKVSTNRYAALASLGAGKPDTDIQETAHPVCKLLSASFSASSDKAEEGEQTNRGRKTAASDTEGQGLSTKKRSLGAGDTGLELGSDPAEGDADDWQVSGSRRHRKREGRRKSTRQPQRKQGSTPPMTSVSRSSRSSSSSSETRGFTPVGGTGWTRSRSTTPTGVTDSGARCTTPTGVTGRSGEKCTTPTGVSASVSSSRRTPPVASSRASPLPVPENWEDEIDPYPVRRGMISSHPTRLACSSWTDPPSPSRPLLPGPPAPLKPVRTRCGITKRPPCLMSMVVKPANPELCRIENLASGAVCKDGQSASIVSQVSNPSASAVSKDSTSPQVNKSSANAVSKDSTSPQFNISASASVVPQADNPSTSALPQLDSFSFSKKLPAACDAGSASGRPRLNVNKGFLGQLISNNEQSNWGRQSPTNNRSRRSSLTPGTY